MNPNKNSEPSTFGTCNLNLKHTDISPIINTTITSPLKDLKTILITLSPPISDVNRIAIHNAIHSCIILKE